MQRRLSSNTELNGANKNRNTELHIPAIFVTSISSTQFLNSTFLLENVITKLDLLFFLFCCVIPTGDFTVYMTALK